MKTQTHEEMAERPPVAGVTAKEIAGGTGLALSTVYRNLCLLQERGYITRIDDTPRLPDLCREAYRWVREACGQDFPFPVLQRDQETRIDTRRKVAFRHASVSSARPPGA